MTRADLLKHKQVWITLAIMIVMVGLWQSMRNIPSAVAKDPQVEQISGSIQQKAQFKTIDVQVSSDADATEAAKVISADELDIGIYPLRDFYFYLDPGHNAAGGPPPRYNEDKCADRGTGGHQPNTNLYEGDLSWNIASALKTILIANGVPSNHIFMSRLTANQYVDLPDRIIGTDQTYSQLCTTYGNNTAYLNTPGVNANNWRFVSIHLNANGGSTERVEVFRKTLPTATSTAYPSPYPTIPLANEFAENMSWQLNRPYPHPNAAYSGDFTRAYETSYCGSTPVPCDIYVVRNSLPRAYNDPNPSNYHHGSYNILAELGYLDNSNFNTWIAQSSNQQAEAQALFRGLADFLVAGRPPGTLQSRQSGGDTQIFNGYRQSILDGRDPGVPFDNGGGYYVHSYGNALSQEFLQSSGTIKGSVLKSSGGGTAYYVRDPLWTTYVQKNGPFDNGPGLPTQAEQSWSTVRRPGGRTYTYPKMMNFQRGAIIWNSYEGKMSTSYDQHAILIANCSASGMNDPTFGTYLQGIARRFALSNDINISLTPIPSATPGYQDGEVHVNDPANRAQLDQTLIWAESFADSVTQDWPYVDIQGYWGRSWIRIGAEHAVANGYSCGGPGEPCNPNSDPYFRPNSNVTRGQFAKMESKARGWTLSNPGAYATSPTCPGPSPYGYHSFRDVCWGTTFYQYVETVKDHNAIGGYPCGGPNEPCGGTNDPYYRIGNNVTRGQMSKIVELSLESDGINPPYPCWYGDMPTGDMPSK